MITKEHKKHSHIARPSYGNYGRNEWAFVGTQCSTVKALVNKIVTALSPQYKCVYADANHHPESDGNNVLADVSYQTIIEYFSNKPYHQFNFIKQCSQFEFRQIFNDADLILLNGNHFEASTQVIIVDSTKEDSLRKKMPSLTNVQMILLADNVNETFDFIKETLPGYNQIPVYKLNETDKIIDFFKIKTRDAEPLLNGLVLAGGKSIRMGYDKGAITWHAKQQKYFLYDLLKQLCNKVYISCRNDQQKDVDTNYETLMDTFTDLGPYGALLSAFRENPDAAWMVIACDLPLLDMETLQYLKQHRNCSSSATTFESPYNNFPEPLITIWEPKSYPVLLSFLSQGYSCPGKVLQHNDTTILSAPNPEALTNVNTQQELDLVQQLLQNKLHSNHAT